MTLLEIQLNTENTFFSEALELRISVIATGAEHVNVVIPAISIFGPWSGGFVSMENHWRSFTCVVEVEMADISRFKNDDISHVQFQNYSRLQKAKFPAKTIGEHQNKANIFITPIPVDTSRNIDVEDEAREGMDGR